MKQEIYFNDFCDAFRTMNLDNNFTYKGKKALFDYLEEYEESTGESVNFDIIALCCEYTEYENLKELQANYTDIESMEDLENNTTVIKIDDDAFIIQNY